MNWHEKIDCRCAELDELIRTHSESVLHFARLGQEHRVTQHQEACRAYSAAKFELRRLQSLDTERRTV